nr:hypothetical protein [Tanacetum cinerariifolium]
MPPKRTSTSEAPAMTQAAIRQLVADSVATALETQAITMANTDNANRNPKPREAPVARKCSYKEFMSCQPFNFMGSEGAIRLIHWFERTESVFSRSKCTEDCKVKFAIGTLPKEALSWRNSFAQPVGIEEAYKITWELATLCPTVVSNSEKLLEALIGRLPRSIKGNITASKPQTLEEATNIAQRLMDQVTKHTPVQVSSDHKQKFDDIRTFNNNYHNANTNNHHNNNQSQQNRRQEVVKANAATPPENNSRGLHIDPAMIEAVKNLETPTTPTEVRQFLGLAGYYRRFIEGFSKIVKPLNKLTQIHKKYIWKEDQESAFQLLKQKLYEAPILALPEGNNDFVVYCDASLQECQKPSDLLVQPEIPMWKWERITMDFVTKFPITSNGHDTIWVIVDHFSKSAHFIPTRETDSKETLTRLYIKEIVSQHGVLISIISDHDSHFTSRFWQSLQNALGTQLDMTPQKGVIRFGKRGKLNPRYIRPFKILKRIGPVAYKIELHEELSNVHNTFCFSNLKKCLSDESLVILMEELQLDDKLNFVEEPVEMMD